jgi:hypothetical protein
VLLQSHAAVGATTYRTVIWVIAENSESRGGEAEFVLSVPPLVRSLLDQVFTVCFISEDPQTRSLQYHKSGWREINERNTRERKRYGNDPKWERRLTEQHKLLQQLAVLANIASEESTDPKKFINYWPIPSQMIKGCHAPVTREFMKFLEDWFYRELSQEAHLSQPGLISRAYPLIIDLPPERIDEHIALRRSMFAMTTITLTVALLSEIQGILRFPEISERLKYLWGLLKELWVDPKDLYERRYQNLLAIS